MFILVFNVVEKQIIIMDSNFSPRIKDVLSYSREEAIRLGNEHIGTEHVVLGILRDGEGLAVDILQNLGIDLVELRQMIEEKISTDRAIELQESVQLLKSTEKILKLVYLEARSLHNKTINTGHLLLAILKDQECLVAKILNRNNVNYYIVKSQMEEIIEPQAKADFPESGDDEGGDPFLRGSSGSSSSKGSTKSETPVLDNFGIDITKAAEDNNLDPIIGREKEIERIAQILSRRKKITLF